VSIDRSVCILWHISCASCFFHHELCWHAGLTTQRVHCFIFWQRIYVDTGVLLLQRTCCLFLSINLAHSTRPILRRQPPIDFTAKSVMFSKHFHTLLNCNDVLYSMVVRCFAISMSLTVHFHCKEHQCWWWVSFIGCGYFFLFYSTGTAHPIITDTVCLWQKSKHHHYFFFFFIDSPYPVLVLLFNVMSGVCCSLVALLCWREEQWIV
jgi:hypothetical protein